MTIEDTSSSQTSHWPPETVDGSIEGETVSTDNIASPSKKMSNGQEHTESDSVISTSSDSTQEDFNEAPISLARFHFFIIDSGWKSVSAKVIRENFRMIREFQSRDPLYVLSQEQSIALIRANPDWIGKDPIILVHDLHAKNSEGATGYCGFRLCLGLIKNSEQALTAMQEFLRFVHSHRRTLDIEKEIQAKLHREGIEGAIEVLGASSREMVG